MEEFISQVHKLDERTYYIDQFDVHIFLILGDKKALLVDTGFACFHDLKQIVSGLTDLPLIVMNTHGHPDHAGGNLYFGEIKAHPDCFEQIRINQGGEGNLKPLNEGDVIDLGGRSYEVILCPGHQKGHVALLNREERVLLPGDLVQREHVVMYLPTADMKEYRKSLERVKAMGDAYDILWPCHGEVPMEKSQFDTVISAVDAYIAGQLSCTDAVGPEGTACKDYNYNGFSILI